MKNWLKLLLVLLFFAVISVGLYFLLRTFNITDISTLQEFILSTKQYGIIVFLLIEVLLFSLFCFVPVLNTALVVLGVVLFGGVKGFLISWLACFLSSSILFFIGDKFGEKLASKLIGKKELEKAQDLIDSKSKILLPVCFTIPVMPDDALCLVAGMTKMKYWYFSIMCIIFRGIDCALVCFLGSGIIDWSSLTVTEWIILINLIIVDVYLLLKFEKHFENRIKNRKNNDKN